MMMMMSVVCCTILVKYGSKVAFSFGLLRQQQQQQKVYVAFDMGIVNQLIVSKHTYTPGTNSRTFEMREEKNIKV